MIILICRLMDLVDIFIIRKYLSSYGFGLEKSDEDFPAQVEESNSSEIYEYLP